MMTPHLENYETISILEKAYDSFVGMGIIKPHLGIESELRMRKFIINMNNAIYAPRYQKDPFAGWNVDDILKMYNLPEKIGPKE